MDSEHRHELEENDLAGWLSEKIEEIKPHLPAIAVACLLAVAGVLGLNYWKDTARASQGQRWREFTLAVDGVRPNLDMLKETSASHPGTPVEEWSLITWADGKLWEASRQFLRDREKADEALAEAEAAYDQLLRAKETEIAQRAAFGLARGAELRGDLETATERYGRVTGAFAELASARAEELSSDTASEDYAWIAETKAVAATATIDPSARPGVEPDDITMPEEETEASIEDILKGLGAASEDGASEESSADAETEPTEDASADSPSMEDILQQAEETVESESPATQE